MIKPSTWLILPCLLLAGCGGAEKLDEKNRQVCRDEKGLEEGTPAFQNCVYELERKQWEAMREAQEDVQQHVQQQRRIIEDYRNRQF